MENQFICWALSYLRSTGLKGIVFGTHWIKPYSSLRVTTWTPYVLMSKLQIGNTSYSRCLTYAAAFDGILSLLSEVCWWLNWSPWSERPFADHLWVFRETYKSRCRCPESVWVFALESNSRTVLGRDHAYISSFQSQIGRRSHELADQVPYPGPEYCQVFETPSHEHEGSSEANKFAPRNWTKPTDHFDSWVFRMINENSWWSVMIMRKSWVITIDHPFFGMSWTIVQFRGTYNKRQKLRLWVQRAVRVRQVPKRTKSDASCLTWSLRVLKQLPLFEMSSLSRHMSRWYYSMTRTYVRSDDADGTPDESN